MPYLTILLESWLLKWRRTFANCVNFSEAWKMWIRRVLSAVSQRRRSGWVQALLTWPDQPARVRVDDANSCAIVARPDDNPDECIRVNATSGCWNILRSFCLAFICKAILELGIAPVFQLLTATRLACECWLCNFWLRTAAPCRMWMCDAVVSVLLFPNALARGRRMSEC